MDRGRKIAGGALGLAPFLIAALAASGCGGAETATGSQVQDISPEARKQIQETVSTGYAKQYKEKYAGKKSR